MYRHWIFLSADFSMIHISYVVTVTSCWPRRVTSSGRSACAPWNLREVRFGVKRAISLIQLLMVDLGTMIRVRAAVTAVRLQIRQKRQRLKRFAYTKTDISSRVSGRNGGVT